MIKKNVLKKPHVSDLKKQFGKICIFPLKFNANAKIFGAKQARKSIFFIMDRKTRITFICLHAFFPLPLKIYFTGKLNIVFLSLTHKYEKFVFFLVI